MEKAVLMFLQGTWLEISPARYQLLDELAGMGFETYVFTIGNIRQRKHFASVHHVVNVMEMTNRDIMARMKAIAPQVVIASTYEDTRKIYLLPWIMRKTKFYYYNLEIYTPFILNEIGRENKGLYYAEMAEYIANKAKEAAYTRKAEALTIQDELRKNISQKYHIKNRKTILIPNSYAFDRDKIKENPGEGVIYTGGIVWWAFADRFYDLKKVKKTNITFSGKIEPRYRQEIARLKETNLNLNFKEQQLLPEEYEQYVQKYAVGLLCYTPSKENENNYYIGLSSGKLFRYLSLGKPVIVIECPGIADEVRKHRLGVVINNIAEIDDAYKEIMGNYEYYRKNIIKTYQKTYDYKIAIKPLLDSIQGK